MGVNGDGYKEVLHLTISETESAQFWLTTLNELKLRGVNEVNIFCSDDFSGISRSINTAFPKAMIQKYVVHQMRNTYKNVAAKDVRAFVIDAKRIYTAPTLEASK